MLTFYLSLGSKPAWNDLLIAEACGQCEVLAPAGSALADALLERPKFRVVLDSWAYPPQNPQRPSLDTYWQSVQRWLRSDGSWRCDWFANYDTIGDQRQSTDAYIELLARAHACGIKPCIVPVTHYPGLAVESILHDLWSGPSGTRDDVVGSGGLDICYGVGGLARSRYSNAAGTWYRQLLRELAAGLEEHDIDPDAIKLHIFGIGRPTWVQQSPYIASVDSAGPARMAAFGWKKIGPIWNALPADLRGRMGITEQSEALLGKSRAARLAFMICYYRSRLGLPWTSIPLDTFMHIDERARSHATIIPFPAPQQFRRAA